MAADPNFILAAQFLDGGGASVNVRHPLIGALGDDSTNNYTALNNRITTLAGADETWEFGPGTYRVNSNLTIPASVAVQFARGAKLKPASGIQIVLEGGYSAPALAHVFDLSAGGRVTGGGFPTITPQHFGAKGDGVNDDGPAFRAAIRYGYLNPTRDEYALTPDIFVPATDDFYLIDVDPDNTADCGLIIDRTVTIRGGAPFGPRSGVSGVRLTFTANCTTGIWVKAPGGLSAITDYNNSLVALGLDEQGGMRSKFYDLVLAPASAGAVKYGFVHNTIVYAERVHCEGFQRAGWFAHGGTAGDALIGEAEAPDTGSSGTMYGNTDKSVFVDCSARNATDGYGFASRGADSQIMMYLSCDATGNAGAGFLDGSFLGNHITNCHTAQNSVRVNHGGNTYLCIKYHTSGATTEPGVGASWETYWWPLTFSAVPGAWVTATVYRASGGVNVTRTTLSHPCIVGHYTEGGIEGGVVPRANTSIFGGETAGDGRVLRHPENADNVSVFGHRNSNTPAIWLHDDGTYEYGAGNGPTDFANPWAMTFGHTDDTPSNIHNGWRLAYSTVRHAWEWNRLGSATARPLTFTGTGWSQGNYSGAGMVMAEHGLILGGPGTNSRGRIRYTTSEAALSGLVVSAGERFYHTAPTVGNPEGWLVTTGGTVGSGAVLQPFGIVGDGVPHTEISYTGLTAGQVLRATSGTAASFGAVDLADTDAVTGTLADARLSSNVGLLTGTQTFTGDKTFSGTLDATGSLYVSGTQDIGGGTLASLLVEPGTEHRAGWFRGTGSGVSAFTGTGVYVENTTAADNRASFYMIKDVGVGRVSMTNASVMEFGIGTTGVSSAANRATLTEAGTLTTTGTIVGPASTTTRATLRVPHGAAPSSPTNGDIWTTTAGLFVRINGSTIGPLS